MRTATKVSAAFALFLTGVLAGIDPDNTFTEEFFDCLLDLKLVRTRIDSENILVMLFAEERRLFRQPDILDQICCFIHANLSANFSNASLVTMIFWNASSCSVFTSEAVFNRTGSIFLAA